MGSGRKRAAVLGFLGLTATSGGETTDEQQAGPWWLQQQQGGQRRHHQYTTGIGNNRAGTNYNYNASNKVRASDEDGYLEGRPWWYAERDIDRRASEFIDRVHRGITISSTDSSSVQH